jgi:hypothetical protein
MKKLLVAGFCSVILFASCSKNPEACFVFSKTANVKVNDTLSLINCSTNYVDALWTLPQNAQTSTPNPRIKMNASGKYEVTLQVGTAGFAKSSTITQFIEVQP